MNILQFKKVNCKNCYKCVRYCPVKAIEVINHRAKIMETNCILCGTCTIVCPQNAKEDISDVSQVKELLLNKESVYVSIAPSYAAYYKLSTLNPLKQALIQLGFTDVFETARGAYAVKTTYEKLLHERKEQYLISSACPVINTYIKKYQPELLEYLAPVVTPMEADAQLIKAEHPDSKVIFIGPCISKKGECRLPSSKVSYVLTFDELNAWLKEESIIVKDEANNQEDKKRSRYFPVAGGILKSMNQEEDITYQAIDGMENCIAALKELKTHKPSNTFIEMSACNGSCIGGPSFQKAEFSRIESYEQIHQGANDHSSDFEVKDIPSLTTVYPSEYIEQVMPSESKIKDILKKMGKTKKEDELNCGMCGYESCREKAIAVYFNKAEISMCLPFMKERAESCSHQIINITPNAILTVDLDLRVLQINDAAKELLHIQEAKDVINAPVSRILDEFDFVNMIVNDTKQYVKRTFLTEYNVYVEQVFLYDKSNSIVICIMKDITKEKRQKNEVLKARRVAADMADDIMEKQLRIVHEIASLLGETAAETKIAIHDLKETILMDEEER